MRKKPISLDEPWCFPESPDQTRRWCFPETPPRPSPADEDEPWFFPEDPAPDKRSRTRSRSWLP